LKEAARKLCGSPKTVDAHKIRLMGKLRIHKRALLVHYAFSAGLISREGHPPRQQSTGRIRAHHEAVRSEPSMSSAYMLSPEIVAQIVERYSPRPEALAGRPVRFPLRHCNAVAHVHDERPAPRVLRIELLDLGFSGVGFEASEPIPRGTTLTIELHVPGLPRQVWVCRVVNVHSRDEAKYRMGAIFEFSDKAKSAASPGVDPPTDALRPGEA
jgi:hypothetical protein